MGKGVADDSGQLAQVTMGGATRGDEGDEGDEGDKGDKGDE